MIVVDIVPAHVADECAVVGFKNHKTGVIKELVDIRKILNIDLWHKPKSRCIDYSEKC